MAKQPNYKNMVKDTFEFFILEETLTRERFVRIWEKNGGTTNE